MSDLREKEQGAASIVGDVRRLFQDLSAPELREVKARIDASEKRADERHADVLEQIEELTRRIQETRLELLEANKASDTRMEQRIQALVDYDALREKVALLEGERQARLKAS